MCIMTHGAASLFIPLLMEGSFVPCCVRVPTIPTAGVSTRYHRSRFPCEGVDGRTLPSPNESGCEWIALDTSTRCPRCFIVTERTWDENGCHAALIVVPALARHVIPDVETRVNDKSIVRSYFFQILNGVPTQIGIFPGQRKMEECVPPTDHSQSFW